MAGAMAVAAAAAEGDGVAVALGEARAVRLVGMVGRGWVVGRGWAALAARTGWRCELLQW